MSTYSQHARIALPNADRILYKLGKHFAIKVPVELDLNPASVPFAAGRCEILRDDNVLSMHCQAESTEALAQLIHIVDSHLALMARDPSLQVVWRPMREDAASC